MKKQTITKKDVGRVFAFHSPFKKNLIAYELISQVRGSEYDYYYHDNGEWGLQCGVGRHVYIPDMYWEELNPLQVLIMFGTNLPEVYNWEKHKWEQ
jgi:hypothetical protein